MDITQYIIGEEAILSPARVAINGERFYAITSRRNMVQAWRVKDPMEHEDHKYFCHGLGLGTYIPGVGGYSVLGADVPIVLLDEYYWIEDINNAREGDVLIFYSEDSKEVVHSCVIHSINRRLQGYASINIKSKAGFGQIKYATLPEIVIDWKQTTWPSGKLSKNIYQIYRKR